MGNITQFGHTSSPQWSQWEGTGNVFLDLLLIAVGFIVLGVSILVTITTAAIMMGTFSLLIKLIIHGATANVLQNLLLSVVAGVFAGIATVIIRFWGRKPSHLEKSFLSALFTKGLEAPTYDKVFWGRVFVGGVVGTIVGLITGTSGALSFPQLISGTAHEVLTNTVYPISEFVVNLTGGAGAGGGFDYWFYLIVLAIALMLIGLLIGVVSGFIVYIIMSGITGLVKGGSKEFIIAILEERHETLRNKEFAPLFSGVFNGLLTGLAAGVLMAVSTIWGIVRFF
jgi:hypothetical protein